MNDSLSKIAQMAIINFSGVIEQYFSRLYLTLPYDFELVL
jgi:hypothetical protein